ncbi:zf-HC2 domain-containing protein [Lederbergia panacisoli]|uniref:zf-HC2 domain-containing protein n=1 Tax=Lederbergia panacisoli TaxID=1255251 RepID=UPI00214CE7FD|nr:zf-HC2 domain-containing protein [Lederbergia panacisoli]MCR2821191.1 zf-HC2 domain-containing protein [Lederbergia panacisoli]
MNKDCVIVEDLLPLYNEGLLQDETTEWVEAHLEHCESCRELALLSKEPIEKENIHSTIDSENMIKKINLKLSIYQIIFIAISFIFAIKTSLLHESFGFILTYPILGLITYLFYRRFLIVAVIAFLPNFIWSLIDIASGAPITFDAIIGSIFLAAIHLIFALVGSIIGLLILKLRERGPTT